MGCAGLYFKKKQPKQKVGIEIACKRNFENPFKEKGAYSIRFNDYLA